MTDGKDSIAASWSRLALLSAAAALCPLGGFQVCANPLGATVSQGTASISSVGSQTTIQTSDHAFINWQSFNIGLGETTTFIQPSSSSVVWNQINSPNPSQILGNLNANGYVILQNQSGFYIGGQASIAAHGLIMTTAPTPPPDLSSGGAWSFNTPPPTAKIINYGQINLDHGGSVYLIANDIENNGSINAPGGNIGLYAGKQVLVSASPDGRGLSASVTLPQGSVDNSGKLIADAGTIAVNAQVVNQGGLVQANSVQEVNGTIELVASDSLTLGPNSAISAKGDTQGTSPGGSITLQSGNTYQDSPTSTVDFSGGVQGGNAGSAEISAASFDGLHALLVGAAAPGWAAGSLTLDPGYIQLVAGSGSSGSGSSAADPLLEGIGNFAGLSQISIQATQNLEVSTPWYLGSSGTSLLLQSGGDLTIDNGAALVGGASVNDTTANGWNITLTAGATFTTPTSVNAAGIGSILLDGNAYLQTTDGSITLNAADNITVGVGNIGTGAGAVRTLAGGSIVANALLGSVDASHSATGGYTYLRSSPGFTALGPSTSIGLLGGISTYTGGDVTITAGQDVKSYLPAGNQSSDAGIGAFGSQPGVVTIISQNGNVYGNYVETDSFRNGLPVASSITAENGNAGLNNGDPTTLLALSVVTGGWNVSAPNGSIALQEVINPNGTFNSLKTPNPYRFFFDYDPLSFVDLSAGNEVELVGGSSIPRIAGDNVPIIYPPSLSITAGAGGVQLDSDVTLFASPYGELSIDTTGGGSLGSQSGTYRYLTMSDSAAQQWLPNGSAYNYSHGSVGGDYAPVPIQLNNPNPVTLNISGDMTDIGLTTPKETDILVQGNMTDVQFYGQNLHPSDKTSITVDGSLVEPEADASDFGGTFGLILGGPGQFNITAGSLDLGASPNGITTVGAGLNVALAAYPGASINLNVANDISMASSTIQTSLGGDINITAGGAINVGTGAGAYGDTARGIITLTGGDIDITAGGTIDVAGSRVATLNGGNISLESLYGDVNAGAGDASDFEVSVYTILNGKYQANGRIYSGSGILAYTSALTPGYNGNPNDVTGNITVLTPQGSIFAEKGGIVQEPLNGNIAPGPTVTLKAGTFGPDGTTVLDVGNIDVTGGGVIGGAVDLSATGNITGLVVGRQNTTVNAAQNFSGTIVSGGNANVSAGGSLSGNVIALGTINVGGGGSVTASLLSTTVTGGGATTSLATTTAPSSTSQAAVNTANTEAQAQTGSTPGDSGDDSKKKAAAALLSPRVGRVTVILPKT